MSCRKDLREVLKEYICVQTDGTIQSDGAYNLRSYCISIPGIESEPLEWEPDPLDDIGVEIAYIISHDYMYITTKEILEFILELIN